MQHEDPQVCGLSSELALDPRVAARPICPWSRSGSVESTETTVTPPLRSTLLRSPKSSSKCT